VKNTLHAIAFLIFIAVMPLIAHADGVSQLKSFLHDVHTLRAQFAQAVLDKNGKTVQSASGTMQFSRPGRFRWTYTKPYEQLIVGDGVKLWVYDMDLNQVTVKKLDAAIGSSPAALLAGSNEIEKGFTLTDGGQRDGMEWVDAAPKSKESTFEAVHMGFGKHGLEAMELHDNFGQTTVIRFTRLERNPKIDTAQFKFTPPKGADVIGE
jgi:outer membrane lipoprotein carrier protein